MSKTLLVFTLCGALILTACGSGGVGADSTPGTVPAKYAGQVNPLDSSAAEQGSRLFSANCLSCHGPEGHGDGPVASGLNPKPRNLAVLQQTAADDYLIWRISTGKPGTAMVGWGTVLTTEQIWQVIAFIRTLQ